MFVLHNHLYIKFQKVRKKLMLIQKLNLKLRLKSLVVKITLLISKDIKV